jgi:hypothetical protein
MDLPMLWENSSTKAHTREEYLLFFPQGRNHNRKNIKAIDKSLLNTSSLLVQPDCDL